ncbi:hypothetical protein WJX73_000565 [Symbiochloris irregularis]|uniref:Protein kinase domain-containing protein n=1 Tax=Symbiochloris irregularis TaxID=706552 RepID=A0AAW1NP14_9CHLO
MSGADRRDWPAEGARRDVSRSRADSLDHGDGHRSHSRPRGDRRYIQHPGPHPRSAPSLVRGPHPREGPPPYREASHREPPGWRSPPKDRDRDLGRRVTPPFASPPDRSKRQRLDERDRDRDAVAAPAGLRTSSSPRLGPAAVVAPSLFGGGLMSDLREMAKKAIEKTQKAAPSDTPTAAHLEDGEEGELPADGPRPPSKRQPIVWRENGGRLPSRSPHLDVSRTPTPGGQIGDVRGGPSPSLVRPKTAAEKALEELGAFEQRRGDEGIDSDAPAAMKASPSGSESGSLDRRDTGEPDSARAVTALKSRWLADAEEEEEQDGMAEAEAQREQAEMRQDLRGGTPQGDENGGGANGTLLQTMHDLMRATQMESMLTGCRNVHHYQRLNKISEGTYGVVYRAREKTKDTICALKKVIMPREGPASRDGFPLTALREVNVLLSIYHPNIVNVTEVVVGESLDAVFMVMEYMDHELKFLMEQMKQPFSTAEVKCLMLQLLDGIAHLHENWVIHRDLKTSNILYNNCGELKICDFGMARQFGSPLRSYTHNVVTLYYRAPELLLGGHGMKYSTAVDMWSVGCIMAELLTKKVLFPARGEVDALDRMWKLLGSPTEENWPGFKQQINARKMNWNYPPQPSRLAEKFPRASGLIEQPGTLSASGFDLLQGLLTLDPAQRMTAKDALQHSWFREHPLPKDKALMPTFDSGGAKPRSNGHAQAQGGHKSRHGPPSPDARLTARAAEVGSLFGGRN